MNDSNTHSDVSLAEYDDAMAAAVRLAKEAQLRLTPEQEAAYRARQKAQEARYDEQRQHEKAERLAPVPIPKLIGLIDRLDGAQVTMRRCVDALEAVTEAAEEAGHLRVAGQCGLAYAALAREVEAVTEVSEALGEYLRKPNASEAQMAA